MEAGERGWFTIAPQDGGRSVAGSGARNRETNVGKSPVASSLHVQRAVQAAVRVVSGRPSDPGRTWDFSVHGTTGKYEFDEHAGAVTARKFVPTSYEIDEAPLDITPVEPTVKVGSAHHHWLDCIERGVQPPMSNARAARHVTEVLLAGLEAGRTGKVVEVHSSADPA